MSKRPQKIRTYIAALSVIALGACGMSASMIAEKADVKLDFWNPNDVNLSSKSYAAADYLISQGRTYIKEYDLIRAKPLTSADTPELSSEFARVVPEQVALRLAQLGYRVDMSAVAQDVDEGFYEAPDRLRTPQHILTGNYMVLDNDDVKVSLRLLDNRTGRVFAIFDYQFEPNDRIEDMLKPAPKIYVVP
jgi:hypothetical protein